MRIAERRIHVIDVKDSTARLIDDLVSDPALDREERCVIVGEIEIWDSDFAAPLAGAVGCAPTN